MTARWISRVSTRKVVGDVFASVVATNIGTFFPKPRNQNRKLVFV